MYQSDWYMTRFECLVFLHMVLVALPTLLVRDTLLLLAPKKSSTESLSSQLLLLSLSSESVARSLLTTQDERFDKFTTFVAAVPGLVL